VTYSIQAGIQISLDGTNWYKLTDHNRKPISISPSLIEKQQRMANGTMRKYVIASKNTISTSWDVLPSKSSLTVDGNHSSAWMQAFYNQNVFLPVYVKVVESKTTDPSMGSYPNDSTFATSFTGYKVYTTYITKFSVTVQHRNLNADYVSMDIEFTEI
jgi:hypothetical protein